jgi:hypothetical protein
MIRANEMLRLGGKLDNGPEEEGGEIMLVDAAMGGERAVGTYWASEDRRNRFLEGGGSKIRVLLCNKTGLTNRPDWTSRSRGRMAWCLGSESPTCSKSSN